MTSERERERDWAISRTISIFDLLSLPLSLDGFRELKGVEDTLCLLLSLIMHWRVSAYCSCPLQSIFAGAGTNMSDSRKRSTKSNASSGPSLRSLDDRSDTSEVSLRSTVVAL